MRRILCIIIAATLFLTMCPIAIWADGQTLADYGWQTDGNRFDGWLLEDGVITCHYNSSATNRMWRKVENSKNFKISFDIICDNKSSPYIQLGGTTLEVDANNGDGNQVFPKVNGSGNEWLRADGCKVHIEINRVNGGHLSVTLTGAGNSSPKMLTAPCGDVENIEIGMYRGGFFSLTSYKEEEADQAQGGDPNTGTDEPSIKPGGPTSEVWVLGGNWTVNEDDTMLILSKATDGEALWKKTLDMNQNFTFSMDWVVSTTIDSNNTWAEKVGFCLKDTTTGDYLIIRLQRYRSSGGVYQIHIGAQWWTAATSSWGPNVLDVWTSKMNGAVLKNVKVQLVRNNAQDALQLKLLDNDDGTSLGSAMLKPSIFADTTVRNNFTEKILRGAEVAVAVNCDGNNAPYYLSNPILGEVEKTVNQNLFACDDVWKPELDRKGDLHFTTRNAGFGWMKYNAGLDVSAGLDFSYAITANDYGTDGTSSAIRLRFCESPEQYLFVRLRFQQGQFAVQGQLWDGSWTDVFGNNQWATGTTEGNTWQVHITTTEKTLQLEIQDVDGRVIGTYSTEQLPEDFFNSKNLELMFCAEGNGLHSLSDFKGLPEIYSADRRSEPFGKVVFAGDVICGWDQTLINDIAAYQNKTPEKIVVGWQKDAILAEQGQLIILSDGISAMMNGMSAADYAAQLNDLLGALKRECSVGTVILVTSLPYIYGADFTVCAEYNTAIRTVALANNVLYANLYRAQSQTVWSLDEEYNPSESGKILMAGEVLQELLRTCTCLAVNATTELKVVTSSPATKTQVALTAFCTAANVDAMKKAILDAHLGADLDLFLGFSTPVQDQIIQALLELDRTGIKSFETADMIINVTSMRVGIESRREILGGAPFGVYVAVGDSISHGETAVNKATDGWVPLFAELVRQAQGAPIRLINKAISGTRMCTVTDNKMFPAAKDTVQEYIVSNNPDLITISYGINDLHAGTSLKEFIATYRNYLTEVVQGCPDALIIVCGLSAKGGDADSAILLKWNAAIKELAEEFNLIYNDSYQDIRGVEWLLSDGLHPSNAGYRVMANAVFRTLSAYVDLDGLYQPGDIILDPQVTEPQDTSSDSSSPIIPWLISAVAALAVIATVATVVVIRKKK